MLIGLRHRFIFVANTKSASTAIERALEAYAELHHRGNPARKHITLARTLEEYADLFARPGMGAQTFFKFGVMREPMDWITSWFRYRKRKGARNPLPPEMSFEEFWDRHDWNFTRADGQRNLQHRHFTAADGTVLADVIIPHHRLGEVFPEICAHLGVRAEPARRNVSRKPAETVNIPPRLRDELRTFYAEDYALFERLDEINAAGMERLSCRPVPADTYV